jgi:hypothetical protein
VVIGAPSFSGQFANPANRCGIEYRVLWTIFLRCIGTGQAGLDLVRIENEQKVKTDQRQVNQLAKISSLKQQIDKIKY